MRAWKPIPKDTEKRIHAYTDEVVKTEFKKRKAMIIRQTLKIICACLNDTYGWSTIRLDRLIAAFDKMLDEAETDEIFWEHIDKLVIEQLDLPFPKENYNDCDR